MLKFLNNAITAVTAFAHRAHSYQVAEAKAPTPGTGAAHTLNAMRMKYKRSAVFGTQCPVPDPGGVHAHMMRHR